MSTLAEISETLKKSNATMESVNALLMQMLNEDKAARDELKEREARDRLAAKEAEKERKRPTTAATPRGFMEGLSQGVSSATGLGFLGGFSNNIMAALFGGASLAAITGTIGSLLGRGLIFGGAAALVGAFADDLIANLFQNIAPSFDPDLAGDIATSLSSNASAGFLAAMFPGVGLRGGVGVMLGGILGDGINQYLGDDENQRVIAEVLGTEITSADAVTATMRAAGVTAMLAGPMTGIVVALAGLAVVAGTRLQEWIESKRNEAVNAIEAELDARLEAGTLGETAGEATLGSTIANALGLNIQDEDKQTVDALIARGNAYLGQIIRNQQAAAGMLDEFAGMDDQAAFGTGAVDLSALDEETRRTVEQLGSTFDQAFEQQREEMANWSRQSLRNMRVMAESLGRSDVTDYIDELLNRPVIRDRRDAAPTLTIADFEGLSIPDIQEAIKEYDYGRLGMTLPSSFNDRIGLLEEATAAYLNGTAGSGTPIIINNVDNSDNSETIAPVSMRHGGGGSTTPLESRDTMRFFAQ